MMHPTKINRLYLFLLFSLIVSTTTLVSCGDNQGGKKSLSELSELISVAEVPDEYTPVNALLVLPRNPVQGESFRILSTGGKNLKKAKIIISGSSGELESRHTKTGQELPYWRLDNFEGASAGRYKAKLITDGKEACDLEFDISKGEETPSKSISEKSTRSWDSWTETLYSAWVNALFQGFDEQASWPSLNEVTQLKDHNFLYNYLSLDEDDPKNKNRIIMEPDCADNPFFMRAYFSWKLGLPFGYHRCDRGYLGGSSPRTGEWVTFGNSGTVKTVSAFNSFLRMMKNGVHSGTARTALDDVKSDYYPVSLERSGLRPGTIYADPYGHTLIIVSWKPQTNSHPGLLLAVDAQPDKTIAIKRFWKGNFLFNTSEVIGEPGFKAFRPIIADKGKLKLMPDKALNASAGFAPFSLQQQKMKSDDFYLTMERLINPKPLDPEDALEDLIKALHEQLLERVKSVANGEEYLRKHPGSLIPMPSGANAVFQSLGQWEDYSTPNRDLRLLIAMDAVLSFPQRVASYPQDFKISLINSQTDIKQKLESRLDEKVSNLTISYVRSDGSTQELTLKEILNRKEAFEMAYNPNDGVEIRWGAPEKSEERSTCRRQAPPYQQKTMQSVRKWFSKRLHPPT